MSALSRNLPEPPKWEAPQRPKRARLEAKIKLVTPMFGGSFQAREVDEQSPVRPAAIRGHLRFWWRALYGANYRSTEEMFAAEAACWGEAALEHKGKPGQTPDCQTAITIHISQKGSKTSYSSLDPKISDHPAYALFPFNEDNDQPQASGLQKVEFTLQLDFPAHLQQQIEGALRAWLLFGGIGARTRRGCGSMEAHMNGRPVCWPMDIPATQSGTDHLFPVLQGAGLFWKQCADADNAWQTAVNEWKLFRLGRDIDPKREFRWPDATAIREKDWQAARFPKAELGLPIVYHFLHEEHHNTTLQGSGKNTRLASPIIVKPLRTGEKQYSAAILILTAPSVTQITSLETTKSPLQQADGPLQIQKMPVRQFLADYLTQCKWQRKQL